MTTNAMRRTIAAAAVLLASACSVLGPDEREQLGLIEILPSIPARVEAPQTARAGEAFTVAVMTHGGGCLRSGATRVRVRGTTADVRPLDVHDGGRVCPMDVAVYRHTATVRFDQPGTATVRFHGRRAPGDETITVTRTVVIQ